MHLITDFLIPLIDRMECKEALYIDAISYLQNTKAVEFYPQRVPAMSFFFERIEQAYCVAETLLENAAYIQKTQPAPVGSIPEVYDLHLWL